MEVRQRTRPLQHRNTERPEGHRVAMRSVVQDTPLMRVAKEYVNQQQLDDPFENQYGGVSSVGGSLSAIQPPYSFYALMKLPQENSVLNQCIDAMVTNIHGHGYTLEYVGDEGKEADSSSENEKEMLENLLDFPNDDYTLQELRDRFCRDLETLGNAYIEVGRDQKGRIVMLSHIPAHTIRMTSKDQDTTEVKVKLPRDGKITEHKVAKRFRRFIQMVGNQRIYFKEYGDPRMVDPKTGQITRDENNEKLRLEDSATEVIHISTYNPNSPYGMPRWFNQIKTILGMQQAEMVNLDFFRDNAIPAMMLLVSGGAVTQASLDQITEHFNSIRGRTAMQRVLVVEATGDAAAADDQGRVPPPRIEVRPMADERQKDGTFQEYDKNGMDKVRSAFRLPPLFIGRSEEMTYATARTAYDVAEGQVFSPERQKFDDMMNLKILSTYSPTYWQFRSNPPRLSSKDELVSAISTFDAGGALSPNVLIGLANELFDLEIDHIEDDWGNFPFEMVMNAMNMKRLEPEDLFNAEPPDPFAGMPGMNVPGAPPQNDNSGPGKGGPEDTSDPTQEGPEMETVAASDNREELARRTSEGLANLSEALHALREGVPEDVQT